MLQHSHRHYLYEDGSKVHESLACAVSIEHCLVDLNEIVHLIFDLVHVLD